MMRRSIVALSFALFLAFSAGMPVLADLTSKDVTTELICQCGCTMVVDTCDCGTAADMTALVTQKISEGQSKEQILGYFVSQYGEKVLAAPTKKGFNLTVWIVPFVAIATGGVAIYFILRRWVWKGKAAPEPVEAEQPEPEESTDEYRRRFREEFDRFSREEEK
ncbi:MAG: cytochrome c-type biogenesis protein CcmH [Chloroflexi bacterium]|nr:cytochrome c-type biogenesis protein CcmH [Chloroflexota bacterium]